MGQGWDQGQIKASIKIKKNSVYASKLANDNWSYTKDFGLYKF